MLANITVITCSFNDKVDRHNLLLFTEGKYALKHPNIYEKEPFVVVQLET